ncbi:MAG: hypothetical protein MUC41_02300 [Syntrophobacteraceae bacterium]|jgi:hypothetical protein|nr:hypothetical protein [Syntrophobacteraceae bacterium]
MVLSVLVFLLATACMLERIEPFTSWYYVFSWWSYIVFAESWLHWKGLKSSLFQSPGRFLLQLPMSVTIWLVFELFNFRLQNWHYVEVPSSLVLRWFGYAVSFATVLPGLNATAALVRGLLPLDSLQWPRLVLRGGRRRWVIGAGFLSLILPLIWPGIFFPFVWLGFILVLGPLVLSAEPDGLVQGLESGKPGKLLELLISGMICGFLWELWNYWAGAKWIYTVPLFGWLKIFEMPLLGFLGFPPFAVECYLMSGVAFLLWDCMEKTGSRARRWIMRGLLGLALLVFWMLIFSGIDRNTVISYGA